MKCFICDKNIKDKSPNRKKVEGQWIHKICPGQKSYKKMKREKEGKK